MGKGIVKLTKKRTEILGALTKSGVFAAQIRKWSCNFW